MDQPLSPVFSDFISLLASRGLSQEQQKDIILQLDEAVALNMIGRLEAQLTSEQKNELISRNPEKLEDLLGFLEEKIPKDNLEESLSLATETVVEKFLSRI